MATITRESLESLADVTPTDMRDAIREAIESGAEESVEVDTARRHPSAVTTWCYCPNAGRGGVDNGGGTQWTDATDLDDVIARWDSQTADDQGRWCP